MPIRYEDGSMARYLTFGCYGRKHLFANEPLAEMFVRTLDDWRKAEQINLYAWVVMVNHVHLLVYTETGIVAKPLGKLKQTFGHHALSWIEENRPAVYRNLSARDHGENIHRFWQAGGGYDRGVYTPRVVRNTVNYIHNNPIRADLVDVPEQYPWSSARAWVTGEPDPIEVDVPDWWWKMNR